MIKQVNKSLLLSAVAALGFCCTVPAFAGHSSLKSTSGGTSTCKLCTIINWEFEIGDLDFTWVYDNGVWTGDVIYTSRPGQTFTGTVCDAANPDDCYNADGTINPVWTDTAEFVISDRVLCTGYVLDRCSKAGRRDSVATYIQSCGTGTECTGRLQAATDGTNIDHHIIDAGAGVDLGGVVTLSSSDCNKAFPKIKGKGGLGSGVMGEIVQRHTGNKSCNAPTEDILDESQIQRACSNAFGSGVEPSCLRGENVAEAGITFTQDIYGAPFASCSPGTINSYCDPNGDFGKFHISVTGAELAKYGVSANDVIESELLCGNKTAPIDIDIRDTDGDGLNDITAQCYTCAVVDGEVTGDFLCDGGQCELTGTDGVQPFAALCHVDLTP